ncbi:MAG: hypothetical protein PHI06_02665 [Desulfobulbaceae bacterium]|nr:hypothetical protein [Desulfobulbaceae bacterium]
MKTSLDSFIPSQTLPQASTAIKTNPFSHERYQAQSQEVSIFLTTQEGDKITISQNASSEQVKSKYKNDEGMSKIASSMASYNMSLTVEGDLNEQELADLSNLLHDLSGIADSFFKGHLDKAIAGALDIGDMGSINKLEATFTHTSILANYLSSSHPLPSFDEYKNDALLEDFHRREHHSKANGPSLTDSMAAQWRQFLDSLPGQGKSDSQPKTLPAASSADLTGKQMFERAKETMNTHPRLTPLMPSIADLSIEQLLQKYGYAPASSNQIGQEINKSFTNELNNWLL